jgi:sodium/proline symporter
LIDKMVAYAWTGLGASFGPPLLLALWWKRVTRQGALAGMVGGMIATVVWQNSDTLKAILDIKAAAVFVSALLVVLVSLQTRPQTR